MDTCTWEKYKENNLDHFAHGESNCCQNGACEDFWSTAPTASSVGNSVQSCFQKFLIDYWTFLLILKW